MRCLSCTTDNIPWGTERCPNPRCQANLRAMMQDVLPPGTLLRDGSLQVEYPLGRGGFGITYLATHLIYRQPVAIKEFFLKDVSVRDTRTGIVEVNLTEQESFKTGLRKFLREGQTLARLNHPGIVQVRDLFAERGTAYLVMEYLRGETLRARMARAGGEDNASRLAALPEPEARRLADAIVESLSVIHARGICHLDLKPGNVILEPDGRVVLIDFGASRQGVTGADNAVSIMAYTPSYAPPELRGANPQFGPESDVYEFGVLLHEMLTGELPPVPEQRPSGSAWQPKTVPPPYRGVIAAAIQSDRARRPRDLRALWQSAWIQKRGEGSKMPLLASGALALAFLTAFVVLLANPNLLKAFNRKGVPDAVAATPLVSTELTPPAKPLAIVCRETGLRARKECLWRTTPAAKVQGKGLCEQHALKCRECGHIWSRKLPEGIVRNYCTDVSHTPEPGEKEDPRFIEQVLRLEEIPALPQTKGLGP